MTERILKLDVGGRPIAWITREDGALLYCREQVAWEAGIEEIVLRGGFSRRTGLRFGLVFAMRSILLFVTLSNVYYPGPIMNRTAKVRHFRGPTVLNCGAPQSSEQQANSVTLRDKRQVLTRTCRS